MSVINLCENSIEKIDLLISELQELRRKHVEQLLIESMENIIIWTNKTNPIITAIIDEIDYKKREVEYRTNSKCYNRGKATYTQFLELYEL